MDDSEVQKASLYMMKILSYIRFAERIIFCVGLILKQGHKNAILDFPHVFLNQITLIDLFLWCLYLTD